MSSFNMPPGVSVNDIPGYDDPEGQRRCACGAFISGKPGKIERLTVQRFCDGKVHSYKQEYPESVIGIIGEQYRGKTYEVRYVHCEQEIETNAVEHEPHWYDSHNEGSYREIQYCWRGHENVLEEDIL